MIGGENLETYYHSISSHLITYQRRGIEIMQQL